MLSQSKFLILVVISIFPIESSFSKKSRWQYIDCYSYYSTFKSFLVGNTGFLTQQINQVGIITNDIPVFLLEIRYFNRKLLKFLPHRQFFFKSPSKIRLLKKKAIFPRNSRLRILFVKISIRTF